MYKNVDSQQMAIYAHDTSADAPKTGDAANITAVISLDGGAEAALTDTNPTEIGGGVYLFDFTQAETNANLIILRATSSTGDHIQIEPVIMDTGRLNEPGNALGVVRGTDTDSLEDVANAVRAEMDSSSTQLASILVDTGVDIPNLIAALNDFNPTTETVTTDTESREASKADVSSLALEASINEIKGATFTETTDSLEAIRDRGDVAWLTGAGGSSPTVEQIRTEMDDNSTKLSSILTATNTDIPSLISALNDLSEVQVKAQADQALTDYDPSTGTEISAVSSQISGLSIPTVSEIATGVWSFVVENGKTAMAFLRRIKAIVGGNSQNNGTEFMNDAGDTVETAVAIDVDNNRTFS